MSKLLPSFVSIYNRHDERGFRIRCLWGLFTIALTWWRRPNGFKNRKNSDSDLLRRSDLRCWRFVFIWRRGAGIIGGRTLYLGWRVKGGGVDRKTGNYRYLYTPALFRLGFTNNANDVPYGFGS